MIFMNLNIVVIHNYRNDKLKEMDTCFNPFDAGNRIFWDSYVKTMAADALAP